MRKITMRKNVAFLFEQQPEQTLLTLRSGLSLIFVSKGDPIELHLYREGRFPDARDCLWATHAIHDILGHTDTAEGTNFRENRNRFGCVTSRWGIVTIRELVASAGNSSG